MSSLNTRIREIAAAPIATIPDVVQAFEAIESLLPEDDGLRWFNWLYLTVTKAVDISVVARQWNNPEWLARLDVVFARLYLNALRDGLSDRPSAPRCWQIMLSARQNRCLARIQFATAGMNAHIDHDLCMAVVTTCRDMGLVPDRGSPLYADYTQVNVLLEALIDEAKKGLRVGLLGDAIPDLGKMEHLLAGFGIQAAREAAWSSAELLWHLQKEPLLSKRYVSGLDRATALAGMGLLIPVL